MWGNKKAEIFRLNSKLKDIEEDIAFARKQREESYAMVNKYRDSLIESEAVVRGFEGQVEMLSEELEKSVTIGDALADENRDLARQLELHRAILKQLNIPVELPKRKK